MQKIFSLAIIGAGPVGLAAAAHALTRGLDPIILEQGPSVGHAVSQWAHVPMFSNWEYNIDAAARQLLETQNWVAPDPDSYPTGGDLNKDYLAPLATVPPIADALRLGTRVVSIARAGLDKVKSAGRDEVPFVLRTAGPDGEATVQARAVIDTSGTWSSPNPAGTNGLPAIGEAASLAMIDYGMPDVAGAAHATYDGKRVAVIGGGHSAIGTLIALASIPDTQLVWLYRGAKLSKAYGGGTADQLAARGALGTGMAALVQSGRVDVKTGFRTQSFAHGEGSLTITSEDGQTVEVDRAIIATGFRPSLDLLREVRIALDPALECTPALAPLIDPNHHSCGTVRPHGAAELRHPEAGFYIAGMKSYGRAPTFLMATGYEQVRSIVAEIAGDTEAAARVELHLPETGVCAGPGPVVQAKAAIEACCGTSSKVDPQPACC